MVTIEQRLEVFVALIRAEFGAMEDVTSFLPAPVGVEDEDYVMSCLDVGLGLHEVQSALMDQSNPYDCAMKLWSGLSTLAEKVPGVSVHLDKYIEVAMQLCVEAAPNKASVEVVALCAGLRGQSASLRNIVAKFAA